MPILRVKFNRSLSFKEVKDIEDLIGRKLNKKFLKRKTTKVAGNNIHAISKETLNIKIDDEFLFMNLLDMFVVEFKGFYENIIICNSSKEESHKNGHYDPLRQES